MEKKYITVTTLNKYLKNKFDTDPHIQSVSLKGEISNFKGHTRGHLYFTIKDEGSRINAVMFQFNANKLGFKPEDGMKVLVIGKVSIYEATGAYQIYIESMEQDGLGNLYLKYEELKKELASLGMFEQSHKKEIPKYPQKIGIVTASTGAAIKDILCTIKRRYPVCETYLFPCLVQGDLAKDDIACQLKAADDYDLDVIIIGRGGGSIEDLWAFNEKIVAQAIYEAKTPIISAVGHEVDFTIADFVADLRAPTPTGAAELAVPNIRDLNILINQYQIRVTNLVNQILTINQNKINSLKNSYVLINPLNIYELKEQKLSNLITNINSLIQNKLTTSLTRFTHIKESHVLSNPEKLLINKKNAFALLINKVELLNPVGILSKGYSIVKGNDKIIKSSSELSIGDNINIKLFEGEIEAKVKKVG